MEYGFSNYKDKNGSDFSGRSQIALVLASMLLSLPSILEAQVIPSTSTGFQFHANIHDSVMIPIDWQAIERTNDDDSRWRMWSHPGSSAISLASGAGLVRTIDLPPLPRELSRESQWSIVVAIDLLGVPIDQPTPGKLAVRLTDPESGKLLAEGEFQTSRVAEVSTAVRPRIWASSFQRGSEPEKAVDGNPDTIWHSKWGDDNQPHWIAIDMGKNRKVTGFSYLPRQDRGNGTIRDYRLEVSSDGTNWRQASQGTFEYPGRQREQVVELDEPVECRLVKLWADSKRQGRGDINGSCAEWTLHVEGDFDFAADENVEVPIPPQREFLQLNLDPSLSLKQLQVELRADDQSCVVVSGVHVFHVPRQATTKMAGKANGVSGPNVLGAGSYGFKGLMIHRYPALPVISVDERSPADRAGLKSNDLIVGINDLALPLGNVEPGFDWFERSHEALLGRAAVEAYDNNPGQPAAKARRAGQVRLNVLREGKLVDLDLRLRLPKEIGQEDFLTNPRTLNLLNKELIDHVLANQKPDGHWPGRPIHTALGGLALLSTGDNKYAPQIKAAANWLCQRFGEPDTDFYWDPSFAGIFLAEYYLASGDRRVLPVIERMLRQMGSAIHTSKWGTDTFGHGPRGLPYENKSLVAVMVHCFVFESLAARCGVDSNLKEILDQYIESAWSNPNEGGHGALGYNASYKDLDEFWSRTGLLTLALKLDDRRPDMRQPMVEIMRKRHPWFRNSHAYGEPGGALGLIGLSQENPSYFEQVFSQYRWWFGVAWEPGYGLHYTPPHMGAPYMEGPVLFNNAYAIVTNIHKKSLHITGSEKTNWLKVDRIPVPLTDVLILQDSEGLVSLRCKIPGPEIRYTIDGSEPNSRSPVYRQPFSVADGTTVKAVAIDRTNVSQVSSRSFALNKTDWKIVSASGNRDAEKAIQRAGYAIDGDLLISWVTDVGENSEGYPHHLVLDIGASINLQQLGIGFRIKEGTANKIAVYGAASPEQPLQLLGQHEMSDFKAEVTIPLEQSIPVQRIKIEFLEPLTDSQLLMVGEIDLKSASN